MGKFNFKIRGVYLVQSDEGTSLFYEGDSLPSVLFADRVGKDVSLSATPLKDGKRFMHSLSVVPDGEEDKYVWVDLNWDGDKLVDTTNPKKYELSDLWKAQRHYYGFARIVEKVKDKVIICVDDHLIPATQEEIIRFFTRSTWGYRHMQSYLFFSPQYRAFSIFTGANDVTFFYKNTLSDSIQLVHQKYVKGVKYNRVFTICEALVNSCDSGSGMAMSEIKKSLDSVIDHSFLSKVRIFAKCEYVPLVARDVPDIRLDKNLFFAAEFPSIHQTFLLAKQNAPYVAYTYSKERLDESINYAKEYNEAFVRLVNSAYKRGAFSLS